MPYEWLSPVPDGPNQPEARLHIWPYRSLPRIGFVWFIGGTAALITVPLFAVVGSPVLWGLLPFLVLAVAGIWWGLKRSYRDAQIIEDLTFWPDRVTLTRQEPDGRQQSWEANPHWMRVELHPTGYPVPNYLTLHGGPRVVELGAFLTPDERNALQIELSRTLASLRP